ncbi:hypothetical protein ACYZT7_10365 [Pseudomonas sp. RT4P38]
MILLLPVAWALVSAAIGVFLYKSSNALFEQLDVSQGKKRTFRLTGSILIAAITFYGIKTSTPSQNLITNNPGMIQIPLTDLRALESNSNENKDDLLLLESCLELDQSGNCRDQLTRLQARLEEQERLFKSILKDVN